MLEPTNGLRFDVYERVHLPEEMAAIDQLEEIELSPQIEVIHQGDQVMLRGNLLLTGAYSSESRPASPQVLEHWIPVEITLPLHRVERVQDIAVEIENFDVDLLSSRTLNVTGVLSLNGLQVRAAEQAVQWEEEEPITVVHRTQQVNAPAAEPAAMLEQAVQTEAEQTDLELQQAAAPLWPDPKPLEEEVQPMQVQERQEEDEEEPASFSWAGFAAQDERERQLRQASAEAQTAPEGLEPSKVEDEPQAAIPEAEDERKPEPVPLEPTLAQATDGIDSTAAVAGQNEALQNEATQQTEAPKQELKIAFASKRPEEEEAQAGNFGIMTLLQSNRREQEAKKTADQQNEKAEQDAAAAARLDPSEEVQWKALFLSNAEEQEFRKVRMCIVQKEETLDTIADRYQLNPRELILYNRLPDQNIATGQVLYIP